MTDKYDKIIEIQNDIKGIVKGAVGHPTPSPETIERFKGIESKINDIKKSMEEKIDRLKDDLTSFKLEIIREIASIPDRIQACSDERYATKEEIKPIKSFVYGLVGFVLLAVLGSVMYLVIK